MAKVKLLSKEVSELIAAGEVIERPSSIIKELVENSIDSGASVVTVEIKNGGITYIRVTDNGSGISEEDVPTAFLRHATSKLSNSEDLNNIMTLGFRGEALASISAISRVEVLTKVASEKYGTHYVIEGTEEKLLEKSGCPDGTTIIIRDIFYNVPARLKFLKKDVVEGNAIASIVNKIALSHPEVSVKFIRENRQELFTPGDGDLYSAIYSVFGKQFAAAMIPVNYEINGVKVKGYTVKPLFGRVNRSFQNYFINGRYVKSMTCTAALEEAYKNTMMDGKFPACVLYLEIAPNVVDVNVHPAKIEVRFTNDKIIFDSVFFSVKNALLSNTAPEEIVLKQQIKSTIDYGQPAFKELKEFQQMTIKQVAPPSMSDIDNSAPVNSFIEKSYAEQHDTVVSPINEIVTPITSKQNFDNYSNNKIDENIKFTEENNCEFKYIKSEAFEKKYEIADKKSVSVKDETNIKIIGEAFKNYIIAEINDEIIIVDKHAAHERVLFEKLKSGKQKLSCQIMLRPVDILLSDEEYSAVSEHKELLDELGFSVELSESFVVIVKGIPSVLDGCNEQDIFVELAKNLSDNKNNPMPQILDEMYHTIACKSAIKANDITSASELEKLVKAIFSDDRIRYCPHGRPIMFKLTKKEIEKQFKRIV